jgi:hypothetical protein
MVAVGMTAENQLPPLAFVLVEGENNESRSWFLALIKKKVLGLDRQVCMITDHHCGLLNGAKEHLEGYPPLIHRWCSRYFAANIWKKQWSKEVIARSSYPVFIPKPRTHRMHDPGSIVPQIRPKVFTDNQMS